MFSLPTVYEQNTIFKINFYTVEMTCSICYFKHCPCSLCVLHFEQTVLQFYMKTLGNILSLCLFVHRRPQLMQMLRLCMYNYVYTLNTCFPYCKLEYHVVNV